MPYRTQSALESSRSDSVDEDAVPTAISVHLFRLFERCSNLLLDLGETVDDTLHHISVVDILDGVISKLKNLSILLYV